MSPEEMLEKPLIEKNTQEDLSEILENMKARVSLEKYIGPLLTVSELRLKTKNRAKNKAAKKVRRSQRKRR